MFGLCSGNKRQGMTHYDRDKLFVNIIKTAVDRRKKSDMVLQYVNALLK